MRASYKALHVLVWLTQAGLSVVVPPVLFIWGGVWLKNRFSLGSWVVILGIALGVLGAVGGLINTFRTLNALGKRLEDPPSPGFNHHE